MKMSRVNCNSVPMLLACFAVLFVAGCADEGTVDSSSVSTPPVAVAVPPAADVDDVDIVADVDVVDEPATETTEVPVVEVSLKKEVVEKGYGDITGQILFDGDVPELKLAVKAGDPKVKDASVCAAKDLTANDLLVDPESKGIANAFVYIYHKNIKKHDIKIHPEAAKIKDSEKQIVFDQKNCRFIPHVMVIRNGQNVLIKSADGCAHNTHTSTLFNDEFNTIISPNDRKGVLLDTLEVPESLPMPVKCDIHPWMKAHWLIINHPYAAVTDKDGKFTIKKLPVGDIEFRVWHERPGYLDRKYVVTVEEGMNELEPRKFAASEFEE
ncbi:MAG: hypothetical protein HON53_03795 [Planctomycetaceae bacterium]|jgi:hypothetical protein|nr:hypothetical protein [Planctomycetaceae bacterium]MBT6154138.1 hypothetical protein [Planctomycetaceae bacterium]MBT6487865.1 hypothetical protein [Planctomycetaceae bacterium]MBT6495673.1 hypothetical protein [Planctomycetaceae bacterium]